MECRLVLSAGDSRVFAKGGWKMEGIRHPTRTGVRLREFYVRTIWGISASYHSP